MLPTISTMSSKKKKISKAKKAKSVASNVKLANKAASKKAQSRRKHKKLKSRLRKVDVKPTDNVQHAYKPVTAIVDDVKEEVKDPDQLEEDDLSFYGTPGHDVSFASTVRDKIMLSKSDGKSKKRKRKLEGSDAEDYERLPRLFSTEDADTKMVLPIKTKGGRIRERFEAKDKPNWEVKQEAAESHDHANNQSEEEPLPDISPIELYALRQEKLRKRREKIAILCSSVMENPSENVGKLRDLIELTEEKDADVYVTVRKLGMISLLEVFKDIIPGYPIRTLSEKEQGQKMKKETISLTTSEDALLKHYKNYLMFLHKTVKGQEKNGFKITPTVQQGLTEIALKCMCDLVVEHPHFNFREDIFGAVVNFMDSKVEKLSDMSCECVKKLFKGDKSGNVTLELTRVIGKMIKAKDFHVKPKVLDTFLSLRIKEVSYTDPIAKREEEKKRANLEKMSRRDKKRRKYMALLERDMKETVATEDKRKRLKLHTETIQAVFLTYFRILKKAPGSNLLPSVLEGLAKYAHLISVDFFNDLFNVLNDLIEAETLSYRESLHCVQTAFTILTGQGSVLNIDPMAFYRHFYKSIFHVHAGTTSDDLPIILNSLDVMISQRKRQVSQQRILAFIKRLAVLALHQLSSGAVGILSALRSFFMTYKYADVLLDNETSGSGVYLPELEDPEHCNAHNAALWELVYLQHHYDPLVRKFALHLCRGAPSQGEGQLSVELRKSPIAMYDMMEKKEAFDKEHADKLSKKSKFRYRRQDFVQQDFQQEVEKILEAVKDMPQQSIVT